MKIKFLGTAAAEGIPAMFCKCELCEKSRETGGKNLRSRSQAIVDGKLLIDFPPDTYLHVFNGSLDLAAVTSCIITHNHSDHLYSADLGNRRVSYAYLANDVGSLSVYGTKPTFLDVQNAIKENQLDEENRVLAKEITYFKPFQVEGYTVTALKADHDEKCMPAFFIISNKVKTIMYANDTGYFPEETWEYLNKIKPYFNFISLDCTAGTQPCRREHMGFETNLEVRERLHSMGCSDKKTIYCSHHFSHNGKVTYDEMAFIAQKEDFLVSFDSMEIEV